jgi:cation diffusion facilitator family transporter
MPPSISSRRVLLVSFLVNVLDVVTNLVVALLTGSAVVFAEMAKGIADAAGAVLLVIGERRAARPSDATHPLGYAREAFFWALLSGISMLVIGAGLSAWRGYQQLVHPKALDSPVLALAVLALSVMTNGYAVSLSARKLKIKEGGLRAAIRNVNRPLVKSAMLRDAVGTATSVVGLFSLALYNNQGLVIFDAAGALTAALCMAVAAILLIAQTRKLIVGHTLPKADLMRLQAAILETPGVVAVNQLAAIYAGASEVLIDTDLDLAEDLDTTQIEIVLDDVEARARAILPEVRRVRVLLNSPDSPPARSLPRRD